MLNRFLVISYVFYLHLVHLFVWMLIPSVVLSFHTEQQYFDIEKKFAESQAQFVSQTHEHQILKEDYCKLGKHVVINRLFFDKE